MTITEHSDSTIPRTEHRARTAGDSDRRGRPDRPGDGVLPRPGRRPVRRPRRARARRRPVAAALRLAAAQQPGAVRRAAWAAVPRAARQLPDRGRDGRPPRARTCRRWASPCARGVAVRASTSSRDGTWRWPRRTARSWRENVVVAGGAEIQPRVPDFAAELDPGIRQLHSSRLPQPRAAAARPGARRGSRPVRRGHRAGARAGRTRDLAVGPGDAGDPGAVRLAPDAARPARAVVRGQPRADGPNADGPADAAGDPRAAARR